MEFNFLGTSNFSPMAQRVKKSACNTGDVGDLGSIPMGWEDPLKKEIATHSSILARKIP